MIVIQAIKPEKSENLHLTEKENISLQIQQYGNTTVEIKQKFPRVHLLP